MSYTFACCSSLVGLPNISKWNTTKVTNMSYMFMSYDENLSKFFSNLYELNSAVNKTFLISKSSSLKTMPDISKWTTTNVTDLSYLFWMLIIIKITRYFKMEN